MLTETLDQRIARLAASAPRLTLGQLDTVHGLLSTAVPAQLAA